MPREIWFKWFTASWRNDDNLRMCGAAARGVWFEMIMIMREATPPGYLNVNGKPINAEDLARLTALKIDEVRAGMAELFANGVYSLDADGVPYCRRVVREAHIEGVRRDAARARWRKDDDESDLHEQNDMQHLSSISMQTDLDDARARDPRTPELPPTPAYQQVDLSLPDAKAEDRRNVEEWVATIPALTTKPARDAARRAVLRVMRQNGATLEHVKTLWDWATRHDFWGPQCVSPAKFGDVDKHGVSFWTRIATARAAERRGRRPPAKARDDEEAAQARRETERMLAEQREAMARAGFTRKEAK